ncbi:AAA family ATPase [Xanthomonas sp. Kuri4-3]
MNGHEGVHGMTTSLDDLDAILGGLKPGGLYVLAARPKMGKTTLAQNVSEHVALRLRKPVAVFSFEMQPDELGDRMLASIGGIDGSRIRSGDLDDVDWSNVTAAMKRLRGAQIFVSKPRRARVEHVSAQARRQHARTGERGGRYQPRAEAHGRRARRAGSAAVRAQPQARGQARQAAPAGGPARLCSIEQDADAVIFIYRDEVYHRDSRWKGTAELLVPLQRNGPPGDCRVLYMPERFKFQNLPEYWQPAPIESDDGKPVQRSRGFRNLKPRAPRQDVDA